MTSNRERSLSAAVDLLGTEGLRALTHARVDDRAGLPKGTTSNYFRTRAALFSGVADWMVQQEAPVVGEAMKPESAAELVDELCKIFEFLTGPSRVMTTARMVLRVEASHDAQLRELLARGRATMVDLVLPAVARVGARDPEAATNTLAACFEGLFMQRIARNENPDPRPVFEIVVRGALA